jgi:hypothetical protein
MGRLLFMDGFDHYDSAHFAEKWTAGTWTINPTAGRNGGCASGQGYQSLSKNLPANYNELIVGYAVWFTSLSGYDGNLVESIGFTNNGSAPIVGVGVNSVGAMQGYQNEGFDEPSAAFGTSANALVTPGTWYYYEYHFNLSAGTLVARLNGVEVMNLTGLTFAATAVNQMHALAPINGPTMIDDLYLIDPSQSPPNVWDQAPSDFLGDIRVATVYVSGPGRLTEFTPTPSSDANWLAVSDAIPDDDATYVSSNTVGATDAYAVAAPAVDTILGVQVVALMEKDSAGTRIVELGVGNGTTEAYGSDTSLAGTYGYTTLPFAQNPLTSAPWLAADLSELQLAVKVTG